MSSSMNIVAHNLQGMFTDRQLGLVAGRKEKSAEKLSSGYRINRSADDAAGLAISEKMRRQIKGLTQGTANAQDGISMCQIADGALAEVHEMLNRITELSVQSANDTNNAEDRQAIQQEVGELLKEIDRVCDTTTFNEQPIFQGAEGVTVIPATYEPTKVDNFSASGTPTGNAAGTYAISANTGGFSINGESHGWSDFKDNSGHTLADAIISAGTYSFTHNGIKMSVEAQAGASMDDVVGKLNGAGYTTKVSSSTKTRMSDIINVSFSSFDRYSSTGNGGILGRGYADNSVPRFTLDDTTVTFHTGLADTSGKEVTYSCTLADIYYTSENNPYNPVQDGLDGIIKLTWYNPTSGTMFGQNYSGGFKLDPFEGDDGKAWYYSSEQGGQYFDPYSEIEGLTAAANGNNDKVMNREITNISLRELYNYLDGMEISSTYYKDQTLSSGIIKRNFSYPDTDNGGLVPVHDDLHDKTYETDVRIALDKVFSPDYKGRELTPEQRISSDHDKQVYIQSGVEAGDGIYLVFGRMDTNILGIHGLDVTTQAGASDAIERAKGATVKLSDIRSEIGAQQNRLEHTIKHQKNTIENTQQAESLIRDTDMATEMMKYTADSVIQQAAQSMLTQANQSNQGVLSLLQ